MKLLPTEHDFDYEPHKIGVACLRTALRIKQQVAEGHHDGTFTEDQVTDLLLDIGKQLQACKRPESD